MNATFIRFYLMNGTFIRGTLVNTKAEKRVIRTKVGAAVTRRGVGTGPDDH